MCRERDETVIHMINECCKLVQRENKTRHDWGEKVIHWELCKKLNLSQLPYMQKPESVPENEANKILWDFETLTDNLISNRRPSIVIVNKKKKKSNMLSRGLCHIGGPQSENQSKREKYLDLA